MCDQSVSCMLIYQDIRKVEQRFFEYMSFIEDTVVSKK